MCDSLGSGPTSFGSGQTGFTFNQPSASTSGFTVGGNPTATSGFTFGNAITTAATDAMKSSPTAFGKSSVVSSEENNKVDSTKPTFSFGLSSTSGDTKPGSGFTFGASSSKDEGKQTPPFMFGAGKKASEQNGSVKKDSVGKANEQPAVKRE